MDKGLMESIIRGGTVQILHALQTLRDQGRMVWFKYASFIELLEVRVAKEDVKTSNELFEYEDYSAAMEIRADLYLDKGEETIGELCELYEKLVGLIDFDAVSPGIKETINGLKEELCRTFEKPIGQITLAEFNDYFDMEKGEE